MAKRSGGAASGGANKKPSTSRRMAKASAGDITIPADLLRDIIGAGGAHQADMNHRVRTEWREMAKAGRLAPEDALPGRGPMSAFHNPFELVYAQGWKERIAPVTYQSTDDMVAQLPLLNILHNYMISQVVRMLRRYSTVREGAGLAVVHKDANGGPSLSGRSRRRSMTKAEAARAAEIEQQIMMCGRPAHNPYSRIPRDRIRVFASKFLRDSLRHDQGTVEVVPDMRGVPFEWYAVSGSTIRVALDQRPWDPYAKPLNPAFAGSPSFMPNFDGQSYRSTSRRDGLPTRYVQVVNSTIVQEFSQREMIFLVRNPRADLRVNGYGWSEIEQSVMAITTALFQDAYHRNFYKGLQRGLVALKGRWGKNQIAKMRRHFAAMASGVVNSGRMPFIELDPSGDIKFIDWHKSEQDTGSLEFGRHLLQQIAAMHGVDGEELGLMLSAVPTGARPMFEDSADWRQRLSKQRWLHQLLNVLAELFQHIIDQIDDHFEFVWEGLDEPTREQLHQERMERVSTYLGADEARDEEGLPPFDIEGMLAGDVVPPLSPTFIQWLSMVQQNREMARANATDITPEQGDQPALDEPDDDNPQRPRAIAAAAQTGDRGGNDEDQEAASP